MVKVIFLLSQKQITTIYQIQIDKLEFYFLKQFFLFSYNNYEHKNVSMLKSKEKSMLKSFHPIVSLASALMRKKGADIPPSHKR